MPVTYRAQCSMWRDSVAERDAMQINPVFHDTGLTSDPDDLADDLIQGIKTIIGTGKQLRVRLYELPGGPGPNYPVAEKTLYVGSAPSSVVPREIALCLSFYSENNVKRKRGRLYIPMAAGNTTAADMVGRPTTSLRDLLASQWPPLFQGLGGVDVDWSIWSELDQQHRPVTDWWIDDEWDIQRRRGLRGTTRTKGTTSEAGLLQVPLVALPDGVALDAPDPDSR
jgi:hypothetical protein